MCAAYRGDIVILSEPKMFIPVKETQVMKKLVPPKLKTILENQVEVKLAGRKKWKLLVNSSQRDYFKKERTKFINL